MDYPDQLVSEMPKLYRFARKLTQDRASAEDLVQETLLKALKTAARSESDGTLTAWLFRILQNTYRDDCRRLQADRAVICELGRPTVSIAANQEYNRYLKETAESINRLTPDHAAILVTGGALQLTYDEIAEKFNLPVGTVRSRLSRARAALKDAMAEAPLQTIRSSRNPSKPVREGPGASDPTGLPRPTHQPVHQDSAPPLPKDTDARYVT